jgi:flagellar biosynthesis protein FlhG
MSDQADKLRLLANSLLPCAQSSGPLPPTIAITGGKGGVGTTTVAINLAVALATAGHRTTLVDAATHPDAAQLAGVDTSGGPCLADVVAGTAAVRDALRTGPAGVHLLGSRWAGETIDLSPRATERLFAQLASLHEDTDVFLVDTGSGTSNSARRFWNAASAVLFVTTPDDLAVMDAYATIKSCCAHLNDSPPEIRTLVNQCDTAAADDDVQHRLASSCQRFLGRAVGRAPRLPVHASQSYVSMTVPRAWEQDGTQFARSVHQLGRCVIDLLAQQRWSEQDLAGTELPATTNAYELSTC